uniref:Uncharacterized protein n=1 Tax=Nelumbo nucifera TaxID=4432 RepID=A0A822XXV3_NELNU|nr:TPA_asm: hypothetical protein HUJ06_027932 [Nelumbo nucifera]
MVLLDILIRKRTTMLATRKARLPHSCKRKISAYRQVTE